MKLAPQEFSFKQLRIDDLPLYNQDDDANLAESVKRLKSEIKAARGVLFVTAENNRSIPGVLENAIDHASRPYGQSAWAGKPAGLLGVSVGAIGMPVAQQHLRNVLACARPTRVFRVGKGGTVRCGRQHRPDKLGKTLGTVTATHIVGLLIGQLDIHVAPVMQKAFIRPLRISHRCTDSAFDAGFMELRGKSAHGDPQRS